MDAGPALRVGLVNAMPLDALAATDRQLTGLLGGSTVLRYRLPGVDVPGASLPGAYRPLEELWSDHLDAVVLTGTEPGPGGLTVEPCWPALAGLLTRLGRTGMPVLLSCLSAHAWLLVHDGLARRRLPAKLSGVFAQGTPAGHPLVLGLGESVLPHSRYNEVPLDALVSAGYGVLLGGPDCGWSVAVDEREGRRAVLIQGHPEYDADTLLREYRRDLARWRDGESAIMPMWPVGYLPAGAEVWLGAHVARVAGGSDEPFPFTELATGLGRPWAGLSAGLVARWLASAAVAHA